jgi:hypothetical protein
MEQQTADENARRRVRQHKPGAKRRSQARREHTQTAPMAPRAEARTGPQVRAASMFALRKHHLVYAINFNPYGHERSSISMGLPLPYTSEVLLTFTFEEMMGSDMHLGTEFVRPTGSSRSCHHYMPCHAGSIKTSSRHAKQTRTV